MDALCVSVFAVRGPLAMAVPLSHGRILPPTTPTLSPPRAVQPHPANPAPPRPCNKAEHGQSICCRGFRGSASKYLDPGGGITSSIYPPLPQREFKSGDERGFAGFWLTMDLGGPGLTLYSARLVELCVECVMKVCGCVLGEFNSRDEQLDLAYLGLVEGLCESV